MSTQIQAPKAPSAWRRWRKTRPFWGGLLVTLSGAEILLAVKAPLPVVLHVGMQGLVGYLVPIVLLLCGILLLTNPAQRLFYSTVAAVLALASWATSNLGGFFFGLLLGLIGSAAAFAWTPEKKKKAKKPAPRTDAAPQEPDGPQAPRPAQAEVAGSPQEGSPDTLHLEFPDAPQVQYAPQPVYPAQAPGSEAPDAAAEPTTREVPPRPE